MKSKTYNKINSFLKNKKQCPICGTYQTEFLPHGDDTEITKKYKIIGSGLRNAKCVKCGSNDRERLMYVYIRDFVKPKGKVLHIAPEAVLRALFKDTCYIKGDYFAIGYEYDNTISMDVRNLPFTDKTFDYVICNHVLEHVKEDIIAMKELYRVCKNIAIIQVPISNIINTIEHLEEYDRYDHVRIYGKDYIKKLESVGFIVKKINISSIKKYENYGINNKENIFVGKKK